MVTSLALVVAGVWAYLAFIRQRLGQPRLITSLSTQVIPIPTGRMIRCQALLENRGAVVATSQFGEIRCRQILPLPPDIQHAATAGLDPVSDGSTNIEWPLLSKREWHWGLHAFEVEPGETDSLYTEFFLPANVEVLEFYFYLANAKKPKQNIGWQSTVIVDLRPMETEMAEKKLVDSRTEYRPLQQGPKEPQSQQQPQQSQTQQQTKVKPKG